MTNLEILKYAKDGDLVRSESWENYNYVYAKLGDEFYTYNLLDTSIGREVNVYNEEGNDWVIIDKLTFKEKIKLKFSLLFRCFKKIFIKDSK